jgi:low affinity Fe/Cu permease
MISRAVWWAVGGLIFCVALQVSMAWTLVITIGTAVIGAL